MGTPAATTRGMKEEEMIRIGDWMTAALKHFRDDRLLGGIRRDVEAFCRRYPVPGLD